MTIGQHIKNNISNKSFKFLSKVIDDITTNVLASYDSADSYEVYHSKIDLSGLVPYTVEDSDDIFQYIHSDDKLEELYSNHINWIDEENLKSFIVTYTTDEKLSFYFLIEVNQEQV